MKRALQSMLVSKPAFLIITILALLPQAMKAQDSRYVYTDLPFTFEDRPKVIVLVPEQRRCTPGFYDPSTGFSRPESCETVPAVTTMEPGKVYTKVLQVQIDCVDMTFDAKGDKKAWASVRDDMDLYKEWQRLCRK